MKRHRSARQDHPYLKPLQYALLAAACLATLVPLAWFLATSLKTPAAVNAFPPRWIPRPLTLRNYDAVLRGSNMPTYFLNSVVVTALTIVASLVLASHVAYAAARYRFRFKGVILFLILATSMIPGICILPSLYMLAVKTRVHDTYLALALVFSASQIPATVWLMRGFFEDIPMDIEEAAKIDGCSTLRAFYSIILPVSRPGLAAGAIIIFINVWNDWLIPVSLTISEGKRLIQVGLFNYMQDLGVEWGKFTAYTILSVIPVVALFLLLQKHFVKGLTEGATKG